MVDVREDVLRSPYGTTPAAEDYEGSHENSVDKSSYSSVTSERDIKVTGHFVPKSFRTILVISYPLLFSVWSFHTQFGHISYPFRTQFGHFVPTYTIF